MKKDKYKQVVDFAYDLKYEIDFDRWEVEGKGWIRFRHSYLDLSGSVGSDKLANCLIVYKADTVDESKEILIQGLIIGGANEQSESIRKALRI